MQCPRCHEVPGPPAGSCQCSGNRAGTTALALPQAAPPLPVLPMSPMPPMSAEARLAHNLAQGFHRALAHPRLCWPLQLARTYWPVAAIPGVAVAVGVVGVKTSLSLLGSALLWGMSVAAQLLGNM